MNEPAGPVMRTIAVLSSPDNRGRVLAALVALAVLLLVADFALSAETGETPFVYPLVAAGAAFAGLLGARVLRRLFGRSVDYWAERSTDAELLPAREEDG